MIYMPLLEDRADHHSDRSMFLHYECGAIIMDSPEIYKMRSDFLKTLTNSEEVLKEEWDNRPRIQKIIAFILNIIAPFF